MTSVVKGDKQSVNRELEATPGHQTVVNSNGGCLWSQSSWHDRAGRMSS